MISKMISKVVQVWLLSYLQEQFWSIWGQSTRFQNLVHVMIQIVVL